MSKYVILLGGDLSITDRLRKQIKGAHFIAADSGMHHARTLGIEPELWLGDFDSSDPALMQEYAHIKKQIYPTAKDQTDGEIAFEHARSAGERTDHSLQHLTMATAQAASGLDIFLTSGDEEAYPILAGSHDYDLPEGSIFSVIAFTELKGFSISGAQWPLKDITVPFGSSLTLSNIVRGSLKITMQTGYACMITQPKAKKA